MQEKINEDICPARKLRIDFLRKAGILEDGSSLEAQAAHLSESKVKPH
jgi:hypothetical protein